MIYLIMAGIVVVFGVVVVIDVIFGAAFALPVIGSTLEVVFGRCLNYLIVFVLFFSCLVWLLVAGVGGSL